MAILKHIRTSIPVLLLITILTITVTTSIQPVFAPRECPGCAEFRILTGEFVQKIINNQQSPNSDSLGQFRILTTQFERDVINAVINDHLSLIPGLVSDYKKRLLEFDIVIQNVGDADTYIIGVLRIFCKPCV